jgi:hypothetical protein
MVGPFGFYKTNTLYCGEAGNKNSNSRLEMILKN